MIINYLDTVIGKIIGYDKYINQRLDNYFKMTEKMREEYNKSYWGQTKLFMIDNRKVLGLVLFVIFLLQIICYFNGNTIINDTIKCSSVIGGQKIQKGGDPPAAPAPAAAPPPAAPPPPPPPATVSGAAKKYGAKASKRAGKIGDTLKSGKGKFLDKKGAALGKWGKGKLSSAKEMGFEVSDRMKAVAGIYFEILYSLVMVFLLGVTLGPIIVLAIIFLVCYKLLKKKMIAIKSL